MSWTTTLAEFRTAIRDRGGYRRSTAITNSMLDSFVNSAISEVHDVLCDKSPDRITTSTTLATVAGVDTVALPSTFYILRGLDLVTDSSRPLRLRQFSFHERTYYADQLDRQYLYRLQGSNIHLTPTPGSVESLRLYYIPHATKLVDDDDVFNGWNGYDELIIQIGLMRCAARDQMPTADIEREIERCYRRVLVSSDARDASEPVYLQNPFAVEGWE